MKPPGWVWALLAIVAVTATAVLSGHSGTPAGGEGAATRSALSADAAGGEQATIAAARRAVKNDDYDRATEMVSALDADELSSILRRIANRLAGRAIAAVQAGDRERARELVIAAKAYPSTKRTRRAHATYKRAKANAVRAGQRTVRAGAKAKAATDGACDPNYEGACLNAQSPDYDCEGGSGDGPDYTGRVRSVGSDPFQLDRDGDGVGCEG